MGFFLGVLWRAYARRQRYRKWFCTDKPARIKAGHVPDGLYDQERSHADQERAGMRFPDELGATAAELRRRWG